MPKAHGIKFSHPLMLLREVKDQFTGRNYEVRLLAGCATILALLLVVCSCFA